MKKLQKITRSHSFRLISGGLYVILASELFFRILAPVPIIPRYVTATHFGIRGNIPGKSYWHRTADFTINIRTNSKGIRADEEIPYGKPAGVKRIVALGDSFGMGYEVDLKDSFLYRMEENLRKEGKNVQVVNLSVSGHGNAEELVMLENEGLKYEPDVVLVCWHVSDIPDNIRSNLYVLEDGILKRNAPTYLPGIKISDMLYNIPLFILVSEDTHLYNWVRDQAGGKVQVLLAFIRRTQAMLMEGAEQPKEKAAPKKSNDYPLQLGFALLNRIRAVSAAHGAKFVILDIPSQASRYEFVSEFPKCPGCNYPVVSPIEYFTKNMKKNELIINERSHFHFTPKGCRLVGQALSDYILEKGLLD